MIWLIILGFINLIMIIFFLVFILPKGSINKIPKDINTLINIFSKQLIPVLIIIIIVFFHLLEVKLIDPVVTKWIGHDFAYTIRDIEGDIVIQFSQYWTPPLVYFFVIIYIAIYTFTLWFSPLYFILGNKKKAMKIFAYGLLLTYIVALPFYLFLPITNVYSAPFYDGKSALEAVIPSIESFFYSTTTINNCFPSMHTAMSILIAYCASLTGNKRYTYFMIFIMISVISSVIYLSIHWITDIIGGAVLALLVIMILRRFIKDEDK
jgi:membrane-associated phospholipid phosphatase